MRLSDLKRYWYYSENSPPDAPNCKPHWKMMPDEECNSEIYLLNKDKVEYLQTEKWKCSAGIGKCTIDYNGDVYCCPFIKNYCLGNLVTSDIEKVWYNKKRYEFLKLIARENNNSRVCIAAKQRVERNK